MFLGIGLGLPASAVGSRSNAGLLDLATKAGRRPHTYLDFAGSYYEQNSVANVLASIPGYAFSRAHTNFTNAYAQTAAGLLVPFASGVPRITDKGYLSEGARTNLALYSQDASNAVWDADSQTKQAAYGTAPDGTATSNRFYRVSGSGTWYPRQSISLSASTAYVVTCYVRSFGTNPTTVKQASLDGTWSVGSAITLTTLWQRVTYTFTTSTAKAYLLGFEINGGAGSGIEWWGFQVEAASFPSSYIPTTSSTATRAADVLTFTLSGVSYPATLYSRFERVVDTGTTEGIMSISDGASSASSLSINTSDVFRIESGGTTVGQSNAGTVSVGVVSKGAGRVLTNDVRSVLNGALGAQDTTASYPNTVTTLIISANGTIGHNAPFGYISQAALWSNYAASDAQLQAMST